MNSEIVKSDFKIDCEISIQNFTIDFETRFQKLQICCPAAQAYPSRASLQYLHIRLKQ